MTEQIRNTLVRSGIMAALVLGTLSACEKHDASGNGPAATAGAAAQQAKQALDQAASFVGQQVDAAKQGIDAASAPSMPVDAATLASAAQAHLQGAASAANAGLAQAASASGAHLEAMGRKLQQWSDTVASSAAAASGASGAHASQGN